MYGVTNKFTHVFDNLSNLEVSQETLDAYKSQLHLAKTVQRSTHWGGKGTTMVYRRGRVVHIKKDARISPEKKKTFFDAHVRNIQNKVAQFDTILKITARRAIVLE
jgi:hypothetical protein